MSKSLLLDRLNQSVYICIPQIISEYNSEPFEEVHVGTSVDWFYA